MTSGRPPTSTDAMARWWREGAGGPQLYQRLRKVTAEGWQRALEEMPADDGPEPAPPPDRPPARLVDLPEVLALRALLQDRRVPFDTLERLMRAMTQTMRVMDDKRPLIWTADDVAGRCVGIAAGAEGSLWSTLEILREFWLWHPDRPFVDEQSRRLLAFLGLALATSARSAS